MAKVKNTIRFIDSVNFEPVVNPDMKDYYQNPQSQISSLRVRIAATHSGKITRNNGFYLPHKMRKSATTFTDQYPKPIQVHHDTDKDPVGRVVEARYVDTSAGIMDAWNHRQVADSKRPIKDELLKDFCEGRLSFNETIDVADKYFIQDENIIDDPDYQGLGYIELVADITDPDAIRKVLDRRYLTGSVGASTDSAVCSVCKMDWAGEDGPCEHRPGKVYDGRKCVLIAGDLEYDEYSFVNAPADRHSTVIEISTGGIRDSVQLDDFFTAKNEEVRLEILDQVQEVQQEEKIKEETKMEKEVEDKKLEVSSVSTTEDVKDETVVPVEEPKVEDATDSAKETVDPAVEAKDENEEANKVEDEKTEVQKEDAALPLNPLDEFLDEDLIRFLGVLKQAIAEREIPAVEETKDSAEDVAKEAETDSTTEQSEVAKDSTETIEALKAEVARLMEDNVVLNDQLAELLKSQKELKLQKINDLNKLSGNTIQITDNLQGASIEDVDKILNDLAGKVDIDKIVDTINSGLSNLNPQGTVDSPVVVIDRDISETKETLKVDRITLEKIREQYLYLSLKNQVQADQYLADLQARGILPRGEVKLENKS